jgi:hypothetical protein
MPADDPNHDHTLQVAASASNGIEADLIIQRLAEAGIEAVSQRSIGGPEWGVSGAQYVYVEAWQLQRARELLSSSEEIGEEELARLSEEAASPTASSARKPPESEH